MYKGFSKQYDSEIEKKMVQHHNRLSERARRHNASIEVVKLGYGSKSYIQKLFNIGQKTIERGLLELNEQEIYNQIPLGKERRIGGGRKKNL